MSLRQSQETHTDPMFSHHQKPLADVFFILGIQEKELPPKLKPGIKLEPKILDLYPKNAEKSGDHPYLDNKKLIAFPEGYEIIDLKRNTKNNTYNSGSFNHFTLTLFNGIKKYATTLVFYERAFLPKSKKRKSTSSLILLPKAFCIVSQLPIFQVKKNFLLKLYEIYINSYGSSAKEAVLQKVEREKDKQNMEFFISMLFHFLYYNSDSYNEVEILERNGALEKVPLLRYRNYKEFGFVLPNFTFEVLLTTLKASRILDLFRIILLERKLILVQNSYGNNALIIESLLSLLTPLQWYFLNCSYMSDGMLDLLDSPFPFILGMGRKIFNCFKDSLKNRIDPMDDIIIFDIDNDQFYLTQNTHIQLIDSRMCGQLPNFPLNLGIKMANSISNLVTTFSRELQRTHNTAQRKKLEDSQWTRATLIVKQIFLNFFVYLINNYNKFYKTKKGDENASAHEIFNFDLYLSNFGDQDRLFMEELTKTQAFTHFIEKGYKLGGEKNELLFFDQCLKKMTQQGEKFLQKEQKKIIETMLRNYNNPVTYSVDECYKVYEKLLISKLQQNTSQGENTIVETPASDTIMDHSRILPMQKINFYKRKAITKQTPKGENIFKRTTNTLVFSQSSSYQNLLNGKKSLGENIYQGSTHNMNSSQSTMDNMIATFKCMNKTRKSSSPNGSCRGMNFLSTNKMRNQNYSFSPQDTIPSPLNTEGSDNDPFSQTHHQKQYFFIGESSFKSSIVENISEENQPSPQPKSQRSKNKKIHKKGSYYEEESPILMGSPNLPLPPQPAQSNEGEEIRGRTKKNKGKKGKSPKTKGRKSNLQIPELEKNKRTSLLTENDECIIADEFGEHEKPIATDLAVRDLTQYKQLNLLSHASKGGTNADRIRSISNMTREEAAHIKKLKQITKSIQKQNDQLKTINNIISNNNEVKSKFRSNDFANTKPQYGPINLKKMNSNSVKYSYSVHDDSTQLQHSPIEAQKGSTAKYSKKPVKKTVAGKNPFKKKKKERKEMTKIEKFYETAPTQRDPNMVSFSPKKMGNQTNCSVEEKKEMSEKEIEDQLAKINQLMEETNKMNEQNQKNAFSKLKHTHDISMHSATSFEPDVRKDTPNRKSKISNIFQFFLNNNEDEKDSQILCDIKSAKHSIFPGNFEFSPAVSPQKDWGIKTLQPSEIRRMRKASFEWNEEAQNNAKQECLSSRQGNSSVHKTGRTSKFSKPNDGRKEPSFKLLFRPPSPSGNSYLADRLDMERGSQGSMASRKSKTSLSGKENENINTKPNRKYHNEENIEDSGRTKESGVELINTSIDIFNRFRTSSIDSCKALFSKILRPQSKEIDDPFKISYSKDNASFTNLGVRKLEHSITPLGNNTGKFKQTCNEVDLKSQKPIRSTSSNNPKFCQRGTAQFRNPGSFISSSSHFFKIPELETGYLDEEDEGQISPNFKQEKEEISHPKFEPTPQARIPLHDISVSPIKDQNILSKDFSPSPEIGMRKKKEELRSTKDLEELNKLYESAKEAQKNISPQTTLNLNSFKPKPERDSSFHPPNVNFSFTELLDGIVEAPNEELEGTQKVCINSEDINDQFQNYGRPTVAKVLKDKKRRSHKQISQKENEKQRNYHEEYKDDDLGTQERKRDDVIIVHRAAPKSPRFNQNLQENPNNWTKWDTQLHQLTEIQQRKENPKVIEGTLEESTYSEKSSVGGELLKFLGIK